MEENKNKQQPQGGNANAQNANAQGGNGGRRRRNRNRHRNGNGGQNPQAQQPQNGQAGTGQKPQPQKQQKPQQGKIQNGGKPNPQAQAPQTKKPQPQQKPQKNQGNKNGNKQTEKKEENRKDTYLYTLDGNLYVNLTNKCSNACDFCVRNERTSYYGNYLWLRHGDPSANDVISAAKGYGDLTRFKEVVFCGFGEPTYKVSEMVALCDYFHEKGLKTRLNTNGQGNLINKRDIVPELKGKIDFVNVSLNASCYEKYQPICRSQFREAGFAGMIDFAKSCRKNGVDCRFSIVDCIGEEEVEACKRLAQSVNVPLYIRDYITDS